MKTIEDYRKDIDFADDGIAALYAKRMEAARAIGHIKAANGAPIENAAREKEILNRIANTLPAALLPYAKELYTTLFETSRAYQSSLTDASSAFAGAVRLAAQGAEFPAKATVACQGVPGAYAHLAAEKLFLFSDITYVKSFEAVFRAVESGLCEFGLLPAENSTAGSVNAVYDLMHKHKFYIVRSIKLPVRHHLLAPKGVSKNEVTEIFSHEQAFQQCAAYVAANFPNAKCTRVENTALAAEAVAKNGGETSAALASFECASLYGLSVLEENVQDAGFNYTRFLCIAKRMQIYKNANKISLTLSLPHTPGSLARLLAKFTALGLNLTKLESRPIQNTDFEFSFYFDFEADILRPEVLNLLAALDADPAPFSFLGSYSEVN